MRETTTGNPLAARLAETLLPQPCSLVIFGGAGDLARRKLLPALYNLRLDGVLPATFAVVGFARTDHTDESYRKLPRDSVEKYSRRRLDAQQWADFEGSIFYARGAFNDPAAFATLKQRLGEIEPSCGVPGNHIYYLSIAPSWVGACCEQLQAAGLVTKCDGTAPFSAVYTS